MSNKSYENMREHKYKSISKKGDFKMQIEVKSLLIGLLLCILIVAGYYSQIPQVGRYQVDAGYIFRH